MAILTYHCSHEQFAPSHLLQLAIKAEAAGFGAIHSSDHFHPWSERQGHSGFSFSWIAAALQATKIPFSMVCAPGQRYHPTIAAQGMATLAEMFPGRINFELGSGEALNETITGEPWPSKKERNERLLECVEIIRNLLNGKTVDHEGLVSVKHAKLYSLPAIQPGLFCAAISKETCAWAGNWADGLLTTADVDQRKNEEKVAAFRKGGGMGKPVNLQFAFSYAKDEETGIAQAVHQWRTNVLGKDIAANFSTVEEFDKEGGKVSEAEVLAAVPVYTSIDQLIEKVMELDTVNTDRIILHNVSRLQELFLHDFGNRSSKPWL